MCKAPEKTYFCSLITSYHRNKNTWLKYYGTNSTNSKSKSIKTQNHWKFSGFAVQIIIKLYKDYKKEPYSFLVNDTTLSDNPLQFRNLS